MQSTVARTSRWVSVGIAMLVVSWVLVTIVADDGADAQGRSQSSVVFSRTGAWQAVQGSDFAGVPLLARARITVPSTGQGTVLVSLTLDFKTSPGDSGVIDAGIARAGRHPSETLRPGSFRIASSRRSSTTLTWVKKHLEPGRTYLIELSARAHVGSGNTARVSGRKLTFGAVAK
jgi:hypothetical protein